MGDLDPVHFGLDENAVALAEIQDFEDSYEPPESGVSSMCGAETNAILRQILANRSKTTDFMSQKPKDDLDHFFKAMASTMRKFPPVTVAHLKLKIAQIVGEAEIAWADERSS